MIPMVCGQLTLGGLVAATSNPTSTYRANVNTA
jgi:hypothetical protein